MWATYDSSLLKRSALHTIFINEGADLFDNKGDIAAFWSPLHQVFKGDSKCLGSRGAVIGCKLAPSSGAQHVSHPVHWYIGICPLGADLKQN